MKKSHIIGLIFLSTILSSVALAGFASAIDPYLPEPEDVEGYELIWESLIEITNPLDDEAANMTAGSQIWAKN
ncbi:MAG: hypothetical protein ACTSRD_09120, partial [Promethearchaeota archaeon]